METPQQIKVIEQECIELVRETDIRFVGVINRLGKLMAGKFKHGVTSHLQDREDGMMYMQLAMEIFLRQEYDPKLGEIDYVLSKRKKVNLLSIPVGKYLILVSTEPSADVDKTYSQTVERFSRILK